MQERNLPPCFSATLTLPLFHGLVATFLKSPFANDFCQSGVLLAALPRATVGMPSAPLGFRVASLCFLELPTPPSPWARPHSASADFKEQSLRSLSAACLFKRPDLVECTTTTYCKFQPSTRISQVRLMCPRG